MLLPENQIALLDALIGTGKKIVVILYGGSPVELPFKDNVNAILNMYLPGERGGEATRKLLFGEKNPCGKLAETWVKNYLDVPYGDRFSKTPVEVYKESVFVGYRYYQKAKKNVAFPFGFGLSYTSFAYSDMKIVDNGETITVTATITNTGNCFGAEIAELYVKAPKTNVYKPERELRGFSKVYLEAKESKEITIVVNKADLAYFNTKEARFVLENGDYEFELCSNCEAVRLSKTIAIVGEIVPSPYDDDIFALYDRTPDKVSDSAFSKMSGLIIPSLPPKKPITLESRFSNLSETFMGKILYNAVLSVAKKDMKKALKLPEGSERDNKIKGALFLKRILESNSLITMSMSAGKSFPYHFAQGFVDLANGRILKGIKDFCSPIKVAPLPKNITNQEKE